MVCADTSGAWPVNEDNKTEQKDRASPHSAQEVMLDRRMEPKPPNMTRVCLTGLFEGHTLFYSPSSVLQMDTI